MAAGFNLAANGGYDFVNGALQYAGVQAVYNWNCCGLSLGYRRFALGSVRDETQYLYSFTLANFGSVGDIRRSNTVFHDPTVPPVLLNPALCRFTSIGFAAASCLPFAVLTSTNQ